MIQMILLRKGAIYLSVFYSYHSLIKMIKNGIYQEGRSHKKYYSNENVKGFFLEVWKY